jgi:hypothetical protein
MNRTVVLTAPRMRGIRVEAEPAGRPDVPGGVTLNFRYRTDTPTADETAYTFTIDEARQLVDAIDELIGGDQLSLLS